MNHINKALQFLYVVANNFFGEGPAYFFHLRIVICDLLDEVVDAFGILQPSVLYN